MTEQLQLDFEKIFKTSDISQKEIDFKRNFTLTEGGPKLAWRV